MDSARGGWRWGNEGTELTDSSQPSRTKAGPKHLCEPLTCRVSLHMCSKRRIASIPPALHVDYQLLWGRSVGLQALLSWWAMPPSTAGNKGCGVWMTSSSLPHLINNQISHNSIYGVAVFCCKDNAGDYPPGQGGSESFQEEREGAGGENGLDSEEEYPASRRPIRVALVELNRINHNGGELGAQGSSQAPGEGVACRTVCCPGPPALGSARVFLSCH